MKLSPHFVKDEFERNGSNLPNEMPHAVVIIYVEFCAIILEPIRERYGVTRITSGYRNYRVNAAVRGAANSFHVSTADRCAADFQPREAPLQEVFDWIRLESGLPFDKVILERGQNPESEGDDCIHIQYRAKPRRRAYLGPTHNQGTYTAVEVKA